MGLLTGVFSDNVSEYDEDELEAMGLSEDEIQLVKDGVCAPTDFDSCEYTEDELDAFGLDENEKELVRQGDYDPWQFEEEDLDEDDYYAEDDI